MHNLRLTEFETNRNVDQQMAFVFQSETCKNNVILSADFLAKIGTDAKYNTGAMELIDNE
jgi:hypothetical protein